MTCSHILAASADPSSTRKVVVDAELGRSGSLEVTAGEAGDSKALAKALSAFLGELFDGGRDGDAGSVAMIMFAGEAGVRLFFGGAVVEAFVDSVCVATTGFGAVDTAKGGRGDISACCTAGEEVAGAAAALSCSSADSTGIAVVATTSNFGSFCGTLPSGEVKGGGDGRQVSDGEGGVDTLSDSAGGVVPDHADGVTVADCRISAPESTFAAADSALSALAAATLRRIRSKAGSSRLRLSGSTFPLAFTFADAAAAVGLAELSVGFTGAI
jgi:hypothetical protein